MYNADELIRTLIHTNRLARKHGFRYVRISDLNRLEEMIATMQTTPAFCAVADNAAGYIDTDNTPHLRNVKTLFLAMRHKQDDMTAHAAAINTMFTLYRQLCSAINREQTRLRENMQYIEPRITFQEVDDRLIPGTAIVVVELAVVTFIDLRYNPQEWEE